MKKIFPVLIIIFLIALAVISPWRDIRNLFMEKIGISPLAQSSISITSKVGKLKVYLNNEEMGETPFEKNDLKPGKHKIRLEKISEQPEFYNNFERVIDIESGTQVVINWEIGPSEDFSSGEIYFFKERLTSTNGDSTVSIVSDPDDAKVYFDGAVQEGNPILINSVKEGDHKLILSKKGYIEEELEIVCKSGYDLFVEVRLFPIPIDIE